MGQEDQGTKKSLLRRLVGPLCLSFFFYLSAELTVYFIYDPALDLFSDFPPDVAQMNYKLYAYDSELIRKMPPNLDIEHPKSKTPMRTNQYGFRGPDFEWQKPEGCFRVVFMGDSSVYGFGLEEKDSIPKRIETLLKHHAGKDKKIEVVNLAVPGYTSFQGVRQGAKFLPILKADIAVIGFGFNDSTVRSCTEKEVHASLGGEPGDLVSGLLRKSPIFELVKNKMFKLEKKDNLGMVSFSWDDKKAPVSRVPIKEYNQYILSMIKMVEKAGGEAVLLNVNMANFYNADHLKRISRNQKIKLIDARSLFEKARPQGRLKKIGSAEGKRRFIIQVAPQSKLPEDAGSLVLVKAPLGNVRYPILKIPLFDDGTHGDQKANDNIYSCTLIDHGGRWFEFAPALEIMLLGKRRGAFLNFTTFFRLPDKKGLDQNGTYLCPPIRINRPPFRDLMVDFDLVHPNEKGAEIISNALAPIIIKSYQSKDH